MVKSIIDVVLSNTRLTAAWVWAMVLDDAVPRATPPKRRKAYQYALELSAR
jgi:hypothetical protein